MSATYTMTSAQKKSAMALVTIGKQGLAHFVKALVTRQEMTSPLLHPKYVDEFNVISRI